MNRRVILTIVIVLVVIAGVVGVGFAGFRMGAAYGISQAPAVATALTQSQANGDVRPYAGGMMYGFGRPDMAFGPMGLHGPFGWGGFGWGGFGFLQCLIPLFVLLLVFAVFRLIFRPWGWKRGWYGGHWSGHSGPNGEGVPPMFEEWHKRAHGQPAPPPSTGDTPPGANA